MKNHTTEIHITAGNYGMKMQGIGNSRTIANVLEITLASVFLEYLAPNTSLESAADVARDSILKTMRELKACKEKGDRFYGMVYQTDLGPGS